MVFGSFVLNQPGLLATGCVIVAAVGAYTKHRRAAIRAEASRPHWSAALCALPAAIIIAALAAFLVSAGTQTAHALLLALTVVVVLRFVTQAYALSGGVIKDRAAWLLVTTRTAAWLIVIIFVARPGCAFRDVEWSVPLLVVLLDQSESMSVNDVTDPTGPPLTRAEAANRALDASRRQIDKLSERYELRLAGIADVSQPLDRWHVDPRAPLTSLGNALRDAGQLRSRDQLAPAAVLVLSDGADTVGSPESMHAAAEHLAAQGTGILAVGVGPEDGVSPTVVMRPLLVPTRLAARDRLRVTVEAQVSACAESDAAIVLRWNDEVAAEERVRVETAESTVRSAHTIWPPGPGGHRLTAAVTLPESCGGHTAETSAVIEVADSELQVLLLDGRPRSEFSFLGRALAGMPGTTLHRMLTDTARLGDTPGEIPWPEYDVVLLGQVSRAALSDEVLQRLSDSVSQHGTGVLLAGGQRMFNEGLFTGTALADLAPIGFTRMVVDAAYRPRFSPTPRGLAHPIFAGANDLAQSAGYAGAKEMWADLPPLGGTAFLRNAKPLAEVLATANDRSPVLVAQEFGRGRCIVAGWESTWSWALASDNGAKLHRLFWRQLVSWLANRRPRPWVITDREWYARSALDAGQRIQIRAGIARSPAEGPQDAEPDWQPELHLRTLTGTDDNATAVDVPLKRQHGEWVGELGSRDLPASSNDAGAYELVFRVGAAGDDPATSQPTLAGPHDTARARFSVRKLNLELTPPTANLAALRETARLTAAHGGTYIPVSRLPGLLAELAEHDARTPREVITRLEPTTDHPWLLLIALALALGGEWGTRKRCGLA